MRTDALSLRPPPLPVAQFMTACVCLDRILSWYREYGLSAALSCDNITLSGTRAISSSSQLTHLVMDIGTLL